MKKITCLLLTALMLFGTSAALVGCGAPKDDGAEIAVYLGEGVYDLDPSDYYGNSNAEQLMSLIYEPLFRVNEKGKLECAAAEKYDINYETREITVTLRESYWSDGARVKAEDFVYAWCERILAPGMPNAAAPLFYDIENALALKTGNVSVADVGAAAVSSYELVITFRPEANVDQLLRNLATVASSPVRQDIVTLNPTIWSKSVDKVFNGPFKVNYVDFITGELTLARNVGYHQSPDTKRYDKIVNPGQLIAFLTPSGEEISVSYSELSSVTFFMSDATLADRKANKGSATVKDDTSVYTYVFNTEHELFADSRVRAALSLAIDRDAIISAITYGKAANGFIPDAFGGSSASLINTAANKTRALELLAEVDFDKIEDTSIELTVNDDEESLAVAEIVKACWEDLGYGITVTVVPAEVVTTKMTDVEYYDDGVQVALKEASFGNRDFDVLAIDLQLYSNDPFVALASFTSYMSGMGVDFTSGFSRENIAGWTNSEYDYLISAAYNTTDANERAALLAEAEALLCAECPVAPLYFNQTFCYISGELKRMEFDAFGNYIFTECKQKNYKKYLKD
ncbi:MAG: hypothetical protein IKA64_03770 [Clostridia bacterium]|nr:hypothetical protein [Clostridia bacterium]